MTPTSRVWAGVALLALLAASPTGADEPAPNRGRQLFVRERCGICHAVAGEGNAKGRLDGVGGRLSGEEIRHWLLDPREMAAKTGASRLPPMPPYRHLKPEELDALVTYLSSLKDEKK
jgi:mono/diheme cytochrome c family protein